MTDCILEIFTPLRVLVCAMANAVTQETIYNKFYCTEQPTTDEMRRGVAENFVIILITWCAPEYRTREFDGDSFTSGRIGVTCRGNHHARKAH